MCVTVCILMCVYMCHGRGCHYTVLKYKLRVMSMDTHTTLPPMVPPFPPILILCQAWEGGALGQAGVRVPQSSEI